MLTIFLFSLVGLSAVSPESAKDPLYLNKKIVKFVESNIGKQVYEGEGIDLPLEALKSTGAKWNFQNEFIFGKEIDKKRTEIKPGDIIQFEKAEFENKKTNIGWKFPNNSVVITSVGKNNTVKFATQNFSNNKIVTLHDLELNTLQKGSFKVFRAVPVAKSSDPSNRKSEIKRE